MWKNVRMWFFEVQNLIENRGKNLYIFEGMVICSWNEECMQDGVMFIFPLNNSKNLLSCYLKKSKGTIINSILFFDKIKITPLQNKIF